MGSKERDIVLDNELENDNLHHREFLEHLTGLALNLAKNRLTGFSKVFIDAPWGYGKSSFLAQLGHIVNGRYLNNEPGVVTILKGQDERNVIHRMSAFGFDACQLDVLNLPEYEMVLEIVAGVSKELGFSVHIDMLEKTAQDLGRVITLIQEGRFVPEVLKSPLHSVNLYSDVLTGRNIKSRLNQVIDELAALNECPLYVVIIDDIDRCAPTKAVRLLDFCDLFKDNPHLLFVFAGDRSVLGANIKTIFGSDFPANDYLDRHFQASYRLPEPPIAGYCAHLYGLRGSADPLAIAATVALATRHRLDLKQTRHLVNDLDMLDAFMPDGHQAGPGFVFAKYFLAVWALTLKHKNVDELKTIMSGQGAKKDIEDILGNHKEYASLLKSRCGLADNSVEDFSKLADGWYRALIAGLAEMKLYRSLFGEAIFDEKQDEVEPVHFAGFDGSVFLRIMATK
ncbi:MAG: P-loop NTPase fold protein [Erysipelotrichaceae bacterium]|nr:P-loop NTPase fold protein [Erysipelotrichaceae bacterium]